MKPILSVSAVRKTFGDTSVLKGVDLEIMPGEVVGLVGANGAGKTTLLNIIAGSLSHDDGDVSTPALLSGSASFDSFRSGLRAGISMVEQSMKVNPALMVAQALFRNGDKALAPMFDLIPAAKQLLEQAGLELDVRMRVGELTRPELGLMETARLLGEDADLVMLDEVGATFNLSEMDEFRAMTELLTGDGRGILYTSHRFDELVEICDRIALLKNGRIDSILDTDGLSASDLTSSLYDQEQARPRRSHPSVISPITRSAVRTAGLAGGEMYDMNLNLPAGSVLALVGPRRSGAEDLIGALTGVRPAKSGTILINDSAEMIFSPEDATRLKITYFSDGEDALIPRHTAAARGLMAGGYDTSANFNDEVRAIEEVLKLLEGFEARSAEILGRKALSLGTQRRMSLVEFMSESSKVMILHEPTAGLDYRARQEIGELISELSSGGRSVLLVSSNPDEVLNWADQIAVVAEGEVLAVIDPAETTVEMLRELSRRKPIGTPTASAPARRALADPYDQQLSGLFHQGPATDEVGAGIAVEAS